jgi:hypothetical protein
VASLRVAALLALLVPISLHIRRKRQPLRAVANHSLDTLAWHSSSEFEFRAVISRRSVCFPV